MTSFNMRLSRPLAGGRGAGRPRRCSEKSLARPCAQDRSESYLKEVDAINTKRGEMQGGKKPNNPLRGPSKGPQRAGSFVKEAAASRSLGREAGCCKGREVGRDGPVHPQFVSQALILHVWSTLSIPLPFDPVPTLGFAFGLLLWLG